MSSLAYAKGEIERVFRQSLENEKNEVVEEKKYLRMLHEINKKIKKANLKSTKQNLLKKKKEIQSDYDECQRISLKCQESINWHLSDLFDNLHCD